MFLEDFLLSLAPLAKFFGACGAPNSRKHYTISALKTNENLQNFRLRRAGHQNPVYRGAFLTGIPLINHVFGVQK